MYCFSIANELKDNIGKAEQQQYGTNVYGTFYNNRQNQTINTNIVAAFPGMHVLPAKHSYVWLPRKCDYRTDTHTQTDRQTDVLTDRHRTKWSLCAAMLRRQHNKPECTNNMALYYLYILCKGSCNECQKCSIIFFISQKCQNIFQFNEKKNTVKNFMIYGNKMVLQ